MNFNQSVLFTQYSSSLNCCVGPNLVWQQTSRDCGRVRARTREGKREIYKDGVRVVWAAYIDGVERNITGHGERVLSWRDGCCGWHHAERVEFSQKPLPVNVLYRPACIQNGERKALRFVHILWVSHKTVCKAMESSGSRGFFSFHGVTHDTHFSPTHCCLYLVMALMFLMLKDKPKKCFMFSIVSWEAFWKRH